MSDQPQPGMAQEGNRPEPLDVKSASQPGKPAGAKSVAALKIAAWVNLVVCTISSIYIFRELGVRLVAEEGYLDYADKIVNPFGITFSLALFLQGIFGCIFFLVVASMAENLMAIRKKIGNSVRLDPRDA